MTVNFIFYVVFSVVFYVVPVVCVVHLVLLSVIFPGLQRIFRSLHYSLVVYLFVMLRKI